MRVLLYVFFLLSTGLLAQDNPYLWFSPDQDTVARIGDIAVPAGARRKVFQENSFAFWLRNLPVKPAIEKVHLYNGQEKMNQNVHYRIIDIDVGHDDLQQCADAVIRLRAEYLYSAGRYDRIQFHFTSGDVARFSKWAEGYRPVITGNQVTWVKSGSPDNSYASFRRYLKTVFMYAGSYSLSRELQVTDPDSLEAGDVFIQGGFPGHAVLIVDIAVSETNEPLFLLAQSYMPAQEMHILKNPVNSSISPWYKLKEGRELITPEWIFEWTDIRRFAE